MAYYKWGDYQLTQTVQMMTIVYPKQLKINAGKMFDSGLTIKQISQLLGVSKNRAIYLAYEGRRLLGTLPEKKAGKPRAKKVIIHTRTPAETDAQKVQQMYQRSRDFVENNVITSYDEESVSGGPIFAIIVLALLGVALYLIANI